MTRILGLDLITASYQRSHIQFAGCLVDTLSQQYVGYEQLTTNEIKTILDHQDIELLAVDNVRELFLDLSLISYLATAEDITTVQLTSAGDQSRSLVQLAEEMGIVIKSKPDPLKSAIICALLSVDYGLPVKFNHIHNQITYHLLRPNTSDAHILREDVSATSGELTHRKVHQELDRSAYIADLTGIVGHGKEAIVYRARDIFGRDIIVKCFRTYSPPAQRLKTQTYGAKAAHIPLLMARDEYRFLHHLQESGLPVPQVYFRDDVFVGMETITDASGRLAPTLDQIRPATIDLETIENYLYQCLDLLFTISSEAQIIHGDFSAHNLLVQDDQIIIIDVSQAMKINMNTFTTSSQRIRLDQALSHIFRDLDGIVTFFERQYRVGVERPVIFEEFLSLIPELFADRVEFVTELWQPRFASKSTD